MSAQYQYDHPSLLNDISLACFLIRGGGGITILFISLIPNSAFFFLLPPLNLMIISPLESIETRSRTFTSIVSSGTILRALALAWSVSNASKSSGKWLRCSVFMHSIPIRAGGSSTCFKLVFQMYPWLISSSTIDS